MGNSICETLQDRGQLSWAWTPVCCGLEPRGLEHVDSNFGNLDLVHGLLRFVLDGVSTILHLADHNTHQQESTSIEQVKRKLSSSINLRMHRPV